MTALIRHMRRMAKRNSFAFILVALMFVVFAYCFWINAAH